MALHEPSPFRYFNSSPEVIRLGVMMYVKYPLSLRNVEDLLAERGVDTSHEGSVKPMGQRLSYLVNGVSDRERCHYVHSLTL